MTTCSLTRAVDLDEDDQLPVWTYAPGEEIVGGLRAWQRLGVGHRCETWLAWSPGLWSPVVVKLARPHQVDHPRAIQSLEREVAALDGLVHPNLPRLIGHDHHGPVPHVVLEYIDGLALDDELDDVGALDDDSVALLGAQLFAALVPIHRRGLAHLDIKPENIMIRDGRPVLADFGSARRIGTRQPAGTTGRDTRLGRARDGGLRANLGRDGHLRRRKGACGVCRRHRRTPGRYPRSSTPHAGGRADGGEPHPASDLWSSASPESPTPSRAEQRPWPDWVYPDLRANPSV